MSKKNKKKAPLKAMSEEEFENQQNIDSSDAVEEAPIPSEEAPVENESTATEYIEAPMYSSDDTLIEETYSGDFVPNEKAPVEEAPIEEPNSMEEIKDKEDSLVEEDSLNEEVAPISDEQPEETSQNEETNLVEPPVEEIHDHKPVEKKKMDKKKKKIILISVLSIILVIGIVLSISLPIYFHFKDKVMISTAEDFNNVDKGKYYVLNKDVTVDGDLDLSSLGNYSIDLNGHSLTVTGDLKFATEDEKTINVGKLKKKEFISGGILQVSGNLIYEAPNASINLLASTQVGGAVINVKNATIDSLSSSTDINIKANDVSFTGTIDTAVTANVNITSANIVVGGNMNSTLNVTSSFVTINPTVAVEKVVLDATSNAKIYGTINTSITGGNKVAMLLGHSCGEYNNIKNLALYRADAVDYTIKACDRIVYVDKLETPADFLIEERADGKIVAVSAKVPFASSYLFTIDDKEYSTTDNFLDISEMMVSGGAGSHVITVTPKGNFDFNTFDQTTRPLDPNKDILYVDGDTVNEDYAYTIKLETPVGVLVDDSSEDGKVLVTFKSVNFASGYTVTVNGEPHSFDAQKEDVQKLDITEYVSAVGTYSIRVSAYSEVKEIEASNQAMTSYTKVSTISPVAGLNATIDAGLLKVSFEVPENSQSFIIYAQDVAGNRIELGRTSLNEFTIEESAVANYNSIVVIAQGKDYYNPSTEVITNIIR